MTRRTGAPPAEPGLGRRALVTGLGATGLGAAGLGTLGLGTLGLGTLGLGTLGPGTLALSALAQGPGSGEAVQAVIKKAMPKDGEALPVIGMGTARTFDVGADEAQRRACLAVTRTFFERGGAVIDSSPMYGSAEAVIGWCLKQLPNAQALYAATKVWTEGKEAGIRQMEASLRLWGIARFDLMQIHNLVDWRTHLETLVKWKEEGRIRHIGITTSHGRMHREFEKIMTEAPLDFVQLSYNILDREAEARLLPLARERGQAVMANRPFRQGELFALVKGSELPPFAAEIDCANWAQFLLKFIVSHPAVTCAIPATRRPDHMAENMGAATGRLPGEAMRARMVRAMRDL